MSGGTRCQSTFTLWCSIFSGFVSFLAPSPFVFDLGVCFISTPNLPVSVLQESLRAGCGTYKDHQTCRLYCSNLRGSWNLSSLGERTVEECTECYLGSGWYGRTYSQNTRGQGSHYVSQVVLLLRASFVILMVFWGRYCDGKSSAVSLLHQQRKVARWNFY